MALPRHLSKLLSIAQGRAVTFDANQRQTAAAAAAAASTAILLFHLSPAHGEPSRRSGVLDFLSRIHVLKTRCAAALHIWLSLGECQDDLLQAAG
jgi:hypothetical protein